MDIRCLFCVIGVAICVLIQVDARAREILFQPPPMISNLIDPDKPPGISPQEINMHPPQPPSPMPEYLRIDYGPPSPDKNYVKRDTQSAAGAPGFSIPSESRQLQGPPGIDIDSPSSLLSPEDRHPPASLFQGAQPPSPTLSDAHPPSGQNIMEEPSPFRVRQIKPGPPSPMTNYVAYYHSKVPQAPGARPPGASVPQNYLYSGANPPSKPGPPAVNLSPSLLRERQISIPGAAGPTSEDTGPKFTPEILIDGIQGPPTETKPEEYKGPAGPPKPVLETGPRQRPGHHKEATTTTTTPRPAVTPRQGSGSGDCRNKHDDYSCDAWAKANHCNINPSWMKKNCAKSCKTCGGGGGNSDGNGNGGGGGGTSEKCVNKHDTQECDFWARTEQCSKNPSFMLRNCYKSCNPNECGGDTGGNGDGGDGSSGIVPCKNKYPDDEQCRRWADRGECDANFRWMNENCNRYCNKNCKTPELDCNEAGCATGKCRNKYHDSNECANWALHGECRSNPQWMNDNCAKSCKCKAPPKKCEENMQPPCLNTDRRGNCACGVSPVQESLLVEPTPQPIVFGRRSVPNAWPWQVTMQLRDAYNPTRYQHQCGGTLIHPQWVLTAAHCVYQGRFYDHRNWRVVLGDHQLSRSSRTEVVRKVARIIRHNGYRQGGNAPNDIAMLKLESPVTLTREIQTACIAAPNQCFLKNRDCWITGWGSTMGTNDEDYLNEVQIGIRSKQECERAWSRGTILDTHICLGYGRESACHGDSGGPLVCKINGKYVLAGVTSWGPRGCQGQTNIYTRVSSYNNWIQDIIRRL